MWNILCKKSSIAENNMVFNQAAIEFTFLEIYFKFTIMYIHAHFMYVCNTYAKLVKFAL